MSRLRVLSGREVGRMLQQHGFIEVRRRGSHIVMQRRTEAGSVTVPIPDHRELALGTLLSVPRRRLNVGVTQMYLHRTQIPRSPHQLCPVAVAKRVQVLE